MKRLLLAIFLLSSLCFGTTAVTGHISTLAGTTTTGNFVRFWLRGCGGNQPRVGGTTVISPTQGGVFYFDVVANSSGDISGTIYSTRDATGTTDGEIECGGSHTATWYGMQLFHAGKGGPETPISAKNGDTFDISNVTPITTNPVVTAPTGDTTYARLDAGNQPFTGNVTPSGTGVLSLGTTTNRWKAFLSTTNVSGLATLSGGGTLTGTFAGGTFTGSTLTSPVINTPTITNPTITGGGTLSGTFSGGTFSGSTLSGPTLSGTVAGSPTASGTWTFSNMPVFPVPFSLSNSGTFTNTQMNEYLQSLLNSCSPTTEYQISQGSNNSTDAIAGCVAMPGGAAVHQVNGIAGYATNSVTTVQTGGAVGGYFQGRVLVSGPGGGNGNGTWGSNSLVQDVVGATSTQMIGSEIDTNALGTPVRLYGLLLNGASTGTIPSLGSAAGIVVFPPGSGKLWPVGIEVRSAASEGIKIAPVATSALPTCNAGNEGGMQPVNDSNSATFNATFSGSGANHIIAYCNGTNWTVH